MVYDDCSNYHTIKTGQNCNCIELYGRVALYWKLIDMNIQYPEKKVALAEATATETKNPDPKSKTVQ